MDSVLVSLPLASISKVSSPISNSSSDSMSRLSLADHCLSSTTVSTFTSSSHSQSKRDESYQNLNDSLMEYLEKSPVSPPSYSSTYQEASNIRFPVYEHEETYLLPDYTPTIHKLTLVLRKVEWLSPYEPSPARSWKNMVMELNSTQVNFYALEGLPLLNRVKRSKSKKHFTFTEIEHDFIINTLTSNPSKYLTSETLIKSYSLQHAKFGIPIDYKKRNYCLRLRIETEQMIVQFPSLDEMINWANYLSTGINVSLDLDSREIPNDRTVPRRRRHGRRSNRNRSYSDSELIRRELGGSKATTARSFTRRASSGEQFIKSKISRIFGRNRSNSTKSTSSATSESSQVSKEDNINQLQLAIQQNAYHQGIQIDDLTQDFDDLDFDDLPQGADISTIREQEEEELEEELAADLRDEDDDDEDEIPDNEIHSIRELHDDSDDESINDSPRNNSTNRMFNSFSFSSAYGHLDDFNLEDDSKWIPDKKSISRRKYLKDALRCIKLLPNDECWVGKNLVRTASPPPFKTCNEFARRNTKNKFVKEFVVGSHALLSVHVN